MIDILNYYTLGFDQDRHMEGFSPGIKCRACLAPYKLSGYGAVAKARANIFCFLKKLSNTCPLKLLLHRGVRNLSNKFNVFPDNFVKLLEVSHVGIY